MRTGVYHDLHEIFGRLNQMYFDNSIKAQLAWGRHRTNSNRRKYSIRLGSYDPESCLITIHPALDQASVPRLCIERIVFHEMLHQKYPAKKISRHRRSIHTTDFKAAEKHFLGAELADGWFKSNLERILRFVPSR